MRTKEGLGLGMVGACIGCLLLAMVPTASAQNVLANAGFEDFEDWGEGPKPLNWGNWGLNWTVDGAHEHAQLAPMEGERMEFVMGPYWGFPWANSGIEQVFDTTAGDVWNLTVQSFIPSSIAPAGGGFGIIKMEFLDAGDVAFEGAPELTIAAEGMALDQWAEYTLEGTAPEGAVKVKALALYLQPNGNDSHGGMMLDDASFSLKPPPPPPPAEDIPATSTWGIVVMGLLLLVGMKYYFGRRRAMAS